MTVGADALTRDPNLGIAKPRLNFQRTNLGREFLDYQQVWQKQKEIHRNVADGAQAPTVLLLEHAEVLTSGRRTQPADLRGTSTPVIEVDRGGRITWHGPGQLVAYPIVPLPQPFDVLAHVRRLEAAVILTCADFGLATQRIEGRSGVWCTEPRATSSTSPPPEDTNLGTDQVPRKIAAVGIRVARSVTMHGVALNVDCDLSWAARIVPCGIADAGVTSLAAELGTAPTMNATADVLEARLR